MQKWNGMGSVLVVTSEVGFLQVPHCNVSTMILRQFVCFQQNTEGPLGLHICGEAFFTID